MAVTIQQAIFTSAQTARLDGYHLVAASNGITPEDSRELAVWCPAHDAMLRDDLAAYSVNFHPVGERRYCVSRTINGQHEYSGRGGRQVYTHCLLINATDFAQFANNPFHLLAAATVDANLCWRSSLPSELSEIKLVPAGKPVDMALFKQSQAARTPYMMTAWFQEALDKPRLALTGYGGDESLFAQFFNLVPVNLRPEFSFSTGLRYSPRRPFRFLGLEGNHDEQRRAVRGEGLSLLDLANPPMNGDRLRNAWATWVLVALRTNLPASAVRLLSQADPQLEASQLDPLGHRLRLQLLSMEEDETKIAAEMEQEEAVAAVAAAAPPPAAPTPSAPARKIVRSHAPHPSHSRATSSARLIQIAGPLPSTQIGGVSAHEQQRLAQLDELVAGALTGNIESLAQLQNVWPEIAGELSPNLRSDVQERYLAYAVIAWKKLNDRRVNRNPQTAASLLDVLSLIFSSAA
ncbi:hypothetical protein [Blastopirellula marina]|uniref:GTPase-associated protein 1 N-terminal domain-containing protein n=1 Tax=Blastopirellula marina TaxID=124 RepID=A0A2S8GAR3_9BACT|nr:hypothetical protein [Blastopirellula marina]PQO26859.1 hypothetical protein C5Y98_29245 [Blastopirellula marina]PQO41548.1 hypothetical protein C5Y93_31045 [Blastopirellula marina]PTL41066.1 hypothetical protein C5Y97_29260 [Blastopirellula marina]